MYSTIDPNQFAKNYRLIVETEKYALNLFFLIYSNVHLYAVSKEVRKILFLAL